MAEDFTSYLPTAIAAAKQGGEVLTHYWGALSHIESKKHSWDLVTEADKEAEEAIIATIQSKYPDHAILAEERGLEAAGDKEHLWVIDPLDGTTNYTHQFPFVAVSIGLLVDEKPVLGVIWNPILQELYHASIGSGAYLNDQRIYTSKVASLEKSLLATGFAYDRAENPENNYREFCYLTNRTQGVRRLGAASLDLAYVAAGRLDGHWERGLKPWDVAAGVVIVQEAGGKVTHYDLSSFSVYREELLATNGHLHQSLSQEIFKAAKLQSRV